MQATSGGGGWPMSVFLTPELQPFLGGTYFPPSDASGRPGEGPTSHAEQGQLLLFTILTPLLKALGTPSSMHGTTP